MWMFCLLYPFIPTQIKFLATPLTPASTSAPHPLESEPSLPNAGPMLLSTIKITLFAFFSD